VFPNSEGTSGYLVYKLNRVLPAGTDRFPSTSENLKPIGNLDWRTTPDLSDAMPHRYIVSQFLSDPAAVLYSIFRLASHMEGEIGSAGVGVIKLDGSG
jgi:hypothetical protein